MVITSDIIQIEVECNISVSDNAVVRDVLPKSVSFYDTELIDWTIKNDIIKKFRIAGLQININSPPCSHEESLLSFNSSKPRGGS